MFLGLKSTSVNQSITTLRYYDNMLICRTEEVIEYERHRNNFNGYCGLHNSNKRLFKIDDTWYIGNRDTVIYKTFGNYIVGHKKASDDMKLRYEEFDLHEYINVTDVVALRRYVDKYYEGYYIVGHLKHSDKGCYEVWLKYIDTSNTLTPISEKGEIK